MSNGFSTKTRGLILVRSDGRCEACGLAFLGTEQDHHRRPRGMGGSSSILANGPANGLRIHLRCHGYIESHRTWALERGLILSQWQVPSEHRVKLWSGWVLLGDDGSVTKIDSERSG